MTDEEWEKHTAEVDAGVLDEYKWFDQHRDEVIAGHHGDMVVISGHKVIGYFKDNEAACQYVWGKNFKEGTFAIQFCLTAKEEDARFFAVWR
jgi:hypothetical protein